MPLAVATVLLFQFAQEDIEKNSHANEGEKCQDAVSRHDGLLFLDAGVKERERRISLPRVRLFRHRVFALPASAFFPRVGAAQNDVESDSQTNADKDERDVVRGADAGEIHESLRVSDAF
ncbi:MAG: hypothetical protein MPK10_06140, partial [Gammaproteobacteria bacterium]|nr:hypothetical protein [Gammaproteobacteria bacterium]